MSTDKDYRAETRTFLNKFFPNLDIKDSDNLFELGFVNSLFAMQLVLFVEKEMGAPVENEELDLANFSSIDAIAGLMERKTAANAQRIAPATIIKIKGGTKVRTNRNCTRTRPSSISAAANSAASSCA